MILRKAPAEPKSSCWGSGIGRVRDGPDGWLIFSSGGGWHDRYFKALEAVKPGQLNALGRPYSPIDVAHAVMGEALGQEIVVKGRSYGKVAGYRPEDGMPIIDTDKEWQALVASQGIKGLR